MQIKDVVVQSRAGQRPLNEDAVLHLSTVPLLAVADGLGGAGAGDVAAQMAIDCLKNNATFLSTEAQKVAHNRSSRGRLNLGRLLESSFQWAHMEIQRAAREANRRQMAVALLTTVIAGDFAYIAHVGNCRAYLLRNGALRRLTEDHTVAAARRRSDPMVSVTPAEERRLIQILGLGTVDVDIAEVPLADNDVLLLCSDGLSQSVPAERLRALIDPNRLTDSAAALLDLAARMGNDNIAVVLARVGARQPPATVDDVAEVIRSVFLFRDLSAAERYILAPYLEERRFQAGEVLVREGEPGGDFYVLIDGSARITRNRVRLIDLSAGSHFGELTLARPSDRSATVIALEPTRTYMLSREYFLEVNRRRPALGAKLSIALLGTIGERLRDLTDRIALAESILQQRPDDTLALFAALRGHRPAPKRS